jgi:hypothetical protein
MRACHLRVVYRSISTARARDSVIHLGSHPLAPTEYADRFGIFSTRRVLNCFCKCFARSLASSRADFDKRHTCLDYFSGNNFAPSRGQ